MYYTVLLVLFVIAASANAQENECNTIFQPEYMRCCSMKYSRPLEEEIMRIGEGDVKECLQIPMKPLSCAREECIAKKKGFFSDGKLDKKAFMEVLDKNPNKDPETVVLIKEKCLSDSSDLSKYGAPDMCELLQLKLCVHFQLLKKCSEWRDTDNCQDMKELMTKCSTEL